MKSINVKAERNYQVKVGINFATEMAEILKNHNKVMLIAPSSLLKKFQIKESRNLSIFSTPEGENQKTLTTLDRVWTKCAAIGIKRGDAIIGFGGGATTDLAGFAAATWLRGISWYAFPTSLAGMVDAAVGGKTGINRQVGQEFDWVFLFTLRGTDRYKFLRKITNQGSISRYGRGN